MQVIDFPKYKIYPDGKVWSQTYNKFLTPVINEKGYYRYQLYKENNKRYFSSHKLVAIHYIPNPDNLNEVDHIDRDKANNNIENLKWVTRRENNHNKINNNEHINIQVRIYGTYRVQIRYQNKHIYNKTFKTLQEAIEARDTFYAKNPEIK